MLLWYCVMTQCVGIRRKDGHIYNIEEMKNNIAYIVQQYIEEDGEFCVNISSKQRATLLQNYKAIHVETKLGTKNTDSGLQQDIESHLDINIEKVNTETPETVGSVSEESGEVVEIENVTSDSLNITDHAQNTDINIMNKQHNDKELVKRYLGIFDEAMEAIIDLIRHDSLPRFYDTKAYETMSQS